VVIMIDPVELIIIGVVVLALMLWGPAKIPELARAFGRAKKEYQKAASEVEKEISFVTEQPKKIVTELAGVGSDSASQLLGIAKSLGITTEGKTSDQIANLILEANKIK
jgi:sec-independent protein translocase protein TatA